MAGSSARRLMKERLSAQSAPSKVSREEYLRTTGSLPDGGEDVCEAMDWTPGQWVMCDRCGHEFALGTEKVDAADGLLICPYADCHGTPLDWTPIV